MERSTKDKLIHESVKLIRKKGLKGLSIRILAERVGIKGASFYEHFNNKDKLLDVVRLQSMSSLYSLMEKGAEGKKSPSKKLIEYGVSYIKYSLSKPDEFHLLFVESESKRKSSNDKIMESSPYSLLIKSFNLLVKDKKNSDIEALCFGFWSMVHGISCLRANHLKNYEESFDKETRKVLEIYLKGVCL